MIFIESGLVTVMIVLGIYCSISDIRTGLIPNRYLLIGTGIGLLLHILLLAFGYAEYYPSWLINMSIGDIISIGMYVCKMWAAGDAKFFSVMFFLFPPRLLDNGSFAHAIIPYIMIFIPALIWIVIDTIIRFIRHEPRIVRPMQIRKIALSFLFVIVESTTFYSVFSSVFPQFAADNGLLFSVITLAYAVFCNSVPFMRRWPAFAVHAVILGVLLCLGLFTPVLPDWKTVLLIFATILLQQVMSLYNYRQLPTSQVSSGMILSAETIFGFSASRVHDLPRNPSEELGARLNAVEAAAVRRWEKSSGGKPTVWIVRKVPFAILILIGFVLWLVIRIVR